MLPLGIRQREAAPTGALTEDAAAHLLEVAGASGWTDEAPRALGVLVSRETARDVAPEDAGFPAVALTRTSKRLVDVARTAVDSVAAGPAHERLAVMAACVAAGAAAHASQNEPVDAAALALAVRDLH